MNNVGDNVVELIHTNGDVTIAEQQFIALTLPAAMKRVLPEC